jgi:hypothetical protein
MYFLDYLLTKDIRPYFIYATKSCLFTLGVLCYWLAIMCVGLTALGLGFFISYWINHVS